MATFRDIGSKAEEISYKVGYLTRTKQRLDEILAEENEKWYALTVRTGDGTEMELYDVPKEVIKNLVTEYRINKLEASIEAGKKEIAEMASQIEY